MRWKEIMAPLRENKKMTFKERLRFNWEFTKKIVPYYWAFVMTICVLYMPSAIQKEAREQAMAIIGDSTIIMTEESFTVLCQFGTAYYGEGVEDHECSFFVTDSEGNPSTRYVFVANLEVIDDKGHNLVETTWQDGHKTWRLF